jgi:hypothetical protein
VPMTADTIAALLGCITIAVAVGILYLASGL